jgi:hypothetical protein
VDGLHARNILCSDAQGSAFALVGDRTLEDDNPVGNYDVDTIAGSPGLSIDFGEDLIADVRVGHGPGGLLGEKADEGSHHIGSADNSDEPSLIDDGNPLHVLRFHQRDKVGEGHLRRHGEDALCHYLADFATMRIDVFLRQPTRADKERDPSSVTLIGTDLGAAEQIAFGDNAENGAVAVRHGQAADAVLQHQLGRVLDRGLWRHGNDKRRHQISCFHGRAPCLLEKLSGNGGLALIRINSASAQLQEHASRNRGQDVGS